MDTEIKLKQLKDRRARLVESPKNWKSPGVIKKLNRQIRNLEK